MLSFVRIQYGFRLGSGCDAVSVSDGSACLSVVTVFYAFDEYWFRLPLLLSLYW